MKYRFNIKSTKTCHQGFYRLSKVRVQRELFQGGFGPPIERELLERGHAAAVLPYDPRADAVVLIEQFRAGALNGDRAPWVWEIVAGYIEPEESPDAVCRRESMEEAGLHIKRMERIGSYIMSPGACAEVIHHYCGEINAEGAGGVFGLPEEGENIRAKVFTLDDALEMLKKGEIRTAPPALALQWLELNRQRIRRLWL